MKTKELDIDSSTKQQQPQTMDVSFKTCKYLSKKNTNYQR